MNRRLVALASAFVLLVSGAAPGMAQVSPPGPNAAPAPAPAALPAADPKVPHYFGPWPNWANSQLTLPDVAVAITGGGGTGAAATATIGANGTVTSLTITDPGSGYTSPPTVTFSGAGGTSASATATINTTGSVTGVTVSPGGAGYTAPVVSFGGGSALPVTKTVGNPLIDRAFATDYNVPPTITPASVTPAADGIVVAFDVSVGTAVGGTFTLTADLVTTGPIAYNALAADIDAAFASAGLAGTLTTGTGPWNITFPAAPNAVSVDGTALTDPTAPALVPVFAVVPTPLPVGTLSAFQTWNQALAAGSPTPSAGKDFRAYVLRPVAGNYTVVYASGLLTVPPLTTAGVSEVATYAMPNVPLLAGDVLGFYGSGIPVDTGAGADIFSYPAPAAPVLNDVVSIPSAGFPLYPQSRTYSFGAVVSDTSGVGTPSGATATAYGAVDAVTLVDPGSGYTMPTVDFDFPDDPAGAQAQGHTMCAAAVTTDPDVACSDPLAATPLVITSVVVDQPGSGFSKAPGVVIRDGTIDNPILGATPAAATASLTLQTIVVDTFGSGYQVAPTVTITDPTGTGALATASTDVGVVSSLTLVNGGSGYLTPGIKKFQDALPGLCLPPACPTTGKYIPLAVSAEKTISGELADTYVIGLVQYRTNFSSSLPEGALVRGYVQIETPDNALISQHFPLTNELMDGTKVPVEINGVQALGVTAPQWLGPTIGATKDKAVRIEFHNLLPTGVEGDLFLPVDTTLMGSGEGPLAMSAPLDEGFVTDMVRNPPCTDKGTTGTGRGDCFTDNRATLHLHGGTTPWISDGTPHQWITPAAETTPWPQGVSVSDVPDMNVCKAANDGCQTFYYSNQQSARLMFYHDHAWGITRLNVYAGEAAGYLITDDTEKKLIVDGTIPGAADTIPLVVQDRTFVPDAAQLALQDPTWDSTRWGTKGSFWYHHVYMPAQNPGDPSGMSAYGRWMYGPWFWPPASPQYPPIDNPYYDPACKLDVPSTWTYDTDPFCEPQQIPGTPNISVGMEQFNDTPIVNGVAYPTITLEPKTYRLRMLNAANDRFMNFQWYVGDPTSARLDATGVVDPTDVTEVALNAAEVAAAQTDINVFPTPVQGAATTGPDWVQIGTEGGFLPAPALVDGQQPTTWIIDPTRFDVGNVDKHSLLLAPAERADTIVDFSKFAGKTLILYNDAPAAFPARVASYDYYTGAPDTGAGQIIPGYGPNTRTIMQVKIAGTAAPAFNLTKLQNAFKHHADGSGVFEESQHPIIVGQAAYNSAYGKTFAASGNCTDPNGTNPCDGLARINQQGGDLFRFDNLKGTKNPQLKIPLQPKALHDEMNSAAFDEFGRMTANLGLEAVPANPAAQNILLYPYIAPPTEVIDGTNLPKDDLNVQAISDASDGTQIWKITHNGVDTHPIHFHLYDVQVLNRVTWDNIIIPTEASELGWKDTVRISPLEDTIVALRPVVPKLPFEIPNSVRPLSPMMPAGANLNTSVGPFVDPVSPYNVSAVTNVLVNFGWEYVYHCHILSHEEMDMMRPVLLALPPVKADGISFAVSGNGNNRHVTATWNDNSISETAYQLQRSTNAGVTWTNVGNPVQSPLNVPNTKGTTRSVQDPTTFNANTAYLYRVLALNTVGYGGAYPSVTAQSASVAVPVILSPTGLTATLQANPAGGVQVSLGWTDNTPNETGFAVQRSLDGVTFTLLATAPVHAGTGATTFVDTSSTFGATYTYRVAANTAAGQSGFSNTASVTVPVMPAAPSNLNAVRGANVGNGNNNRSVNLTWTDNANNESGFTVQRATNAAFTAGLNSTNVAANATALSVTGLSRNTNYYFRIRANSGPIVSSAWVNATPLPILTLP